VLYPPSPSFLKSGLDLKIESKYTCCLFVVTVFKEEGGALEWTVKDREECEIFILLLSTPFVTFF